MGYAEQYRLLNYSETLRTVPLQHRDDVYKRLDGHPRGYEYLEALLKKDKTFRWEQVAQSEEKVFENLLLAKVYERLTEREQAIFRMVAVFIARTPLAALATVSGETEADLLPVLGFLQDWSLCFVEADGRFEVHRLTREWMAKGLIPAAYVKELAFKAGEYFENHPTLDNYELARTYYEIATAWKDFASISFSLQSVYERIGLNQRVTELNQVVLDKNIDDKRNSLALHNIAYLLLKTGSYDEALPIFEQSLELYSKIGDRKNEGATLNNISQIYSAKGDYDTALRYLEQSLAIRQQIGDIAGLATTLNNMGAIYLLQKNEVENATIAFWQSYSILKKIGSPNAQVPESYLGIIIERIGEAKFREIIAVIG